jgi:hypothetical protein
MKDFNTAIAQAKLEYISDIEWAYRFENQFICVDFYKDESGINHVEEFCVNQKGLWIEVIPTDEQLQTMWKILNNTPYREVEVEEFGTNNDAESDPYYGIYGI